MFSTFTAIWFQSKESLHLCSNHAAGSRVIRKKGKKESVYISVLRCDQAVRRGGGSENYLSRLTLVQHLLKPPVLFIVWVCTGQPRRSGHEVGRKFSYSCPNTLHRETDTHRTEVLHYCCSTPPPHDALLKYLKRSEGVNFKRRPPISGTGILMVTLYGVLILWVTIQVITFLKGLILKIGFVLIIIISVHLPQFHPCKRWTAIIISK